MRWITAAPDSGVRDVPPPAGRRDLLVVLALALLAVADIPEGVATWQPMSASVGLVAAAATYWRRSDPLIALIVAFGALFSLEVASGLTDTTVQATFGHVLTLGVLVFATGRWATWRGIAVGLGVVLVLAVAGEALMAAPDWGEQFNDVLLWAMLAAIGVAIRYRKVSQRTRADQIRAEERERIARDLHDVVAHHVSAIALQAEGARAAAMTNPTAAVDALERIHGTASTTLTEMRRMVAVLRDDSEPGALSPLTKLDELRQLFNENTQDLPVDLSLVGGIDTLPSSVTAAVWRVTQEAVTNARRHSRNATAISVVIERDDNNVEVSVTDDGERVGPTQSSGYGIIGMTERCTMLGGTLSAGPINGGGWHVRATIPAQSDLSESSTR